MAKGGSCNRFKPTLFSSLFGTRASSKRASSRFILRELQLPRENKKKKKKKSCLSPSLPARLLLYNYQRREKDLVPPSLSFSRPVNAQAQRPVSTWGSLFSHQRSSASSNSIASVTIFRLGTAGPGHYYTVNSLLDWTLSLSTHLPSSALISPGILSLF
jgi:hypothetical protein